MTTASEPLVHIGLHKTGSTWMQNRIFADPRYGYTQVEPRTVVDEAWIAVNDFAFDPDRARALFEPFAQRAEQSSTALVISHERLSGLPLMGAFDARTIADRIAATFPRAKILVVIREQRDIVLSIYKQHVTQFGRDPFEKIWRRRTIMEQRRPGPTLDAFEYDRMIAHYQAAFGADRVLVLPFEDLKRDARGFVGRIASFAGVPAPDEIPTDRENEALPSAAVAFVRYLNIAARVLGIGTLFTGPVAERRAQRVRLAVLLRAGRLMPRRFSDRVDTRWRTAVDELAGEAFAESNRRTSQLTGLDLASLGYTVAPERAPASVDAD